MQTTLITGGAGFIGSHLTERLLLRGDRVVVLDDLSTGRRDNLRSSLDDRRLEIVAGSVTDKALLESLVARANRVFHLAACVGVRLISEEPVRAIVTDVNATTSVLEACCEYRRPVLMASSSEVYGKSKALPFLEDAELILGPSTRPRWAYACAKAMGEFLGLAYFRKHGLTVVIARLFNVAGPRQRGRYGMVLPRFIKQALSARPITVYGDGSQRRCFCHVDEVAQALGLLLDAPAARGEVVNLGGDHMVSIEELAMLVKTVTGSASEIVHVPFEEAYEPGFDDINARQPDLAKARRLIGFQPRLGLERIIEDAVRDLRHF